MNRVLRELRLCFAVSVGAVMVLISLLEGPIVSRRRLSRRRHPTTRVSQMGMRRRTPWSLRFFRFLLRKTAPAPRRSPRHDDARPGWDPPLSLGQRC